MTMTNEQREAIEDRYNINRNQERMIMAMGKLQEAKDLIDEADGNNSLEELAGVLPVAGGEIGKQIYELKKVLGIKPNDFEDGMYNPANYPKASNNTPADNVPVTVNDYLGLYDAVASLYKAIEAQNLSKAVNFAQFIQEMAIDYADPNSEANQNQN